MILMIFLIIIGFQYFNDFHDYRVEFCEFQNFIDSQMELLDSPDYQNSPIVI